jgi:hypothetical protein
VLSVASSVMPIQYGRKFIFFKFEFSPVHSTYIMLRRNLAGLLNFDAVDTDLAAHSHDTNLLHECARFGYLDLLKSLDFYIRGDERVAVLKKAIRGHQEECINWFIDRQCKLPIGYIIVRCIKHDYTKIFSKMNMSPDAWVNAIIVNDAIECMRLCNISFEEMKESAIRNGATRILTYALGHADVRVDDIVAAASRGLSNSLNIIFKFAPQGVIEDATKISETNKMCIDLRQIIKYYLG